MDLLRIGACCFAAVFGLAGCGGGATDEAAAGTHTQGLTLEQNRILGFENAPADWSASNGAPITSSSTASAGSAALSIQLNGYTQIQSLKLAAPGGATSTASLDIRVPTQLPWGEARLIARAPSLGHHWADLGGSALQNLAPGAFRTLTFSVPQYIQNALNSSATDISFVIVLNGPSGVGPVLIDKLVVSSGSSGTPPSQDGQAVSFSLQVPRGSAVADTLMCATGELVIDDRSTLGEQGKLTTIASTGPGTSEFGAGVKAFTNIISEGSVDFLRSQSTVYGHITTEGTVLKQDNVSTLGGITERASVNSVTTTWTVSWPPSAAAPVNLPPDAPNLELAPGSYGSLVAYSRSTLTLTSGNYFFGSFVLEPEARFRVRAGSGPVVIYVRDALRLNVGLSYLSGQEGQVLFAYLGSDAPLLREGLAASVVAPNASIELRRPSSGTAFRGSYFGRDVHVFSDATVRHIPLDWAFVCPLGDFDKDGVFDCSDKCRFNAAKSEPGICGCSKADTHSDTDGVPDCEDACPTDSATSFKGTCGCPSNPAPAGTPCFDGICFGAGQTCDGQGQCGDLSCRPHPSCRPLYAASNDKFYWICDHQVTRDAAATLCAGQQGSKLASISEERINRLITSNATTDVWIGANAIDQTGEWHWLDYATNSGRKLWAGGPTGGPVYSRFNAFSVPPAASAACAYAKTNASWTAASCTETHGFVCEVSNDRLIDWPSQRPKRPTEIVGIPEYQPPGTDCVDPETWLGDQDDEAEVLGLFAACQTCLEVNGEGPACDSVCVGPAAIPDVNSACSLSDDEFLVGRAACGEQSLPIAYDAGGNEIPCVKSADCVGEPPAAGPQRCETNAECTGANERCVSDYCTVVLMCDTQAGRCVVPSNSCPAGEEELPSRCGEVEFCEPPPTQTTTTIEATGADLQPLPSDPADFFGEEPQLPAEIPPYDGESCQGCGALDRTTHPWCRVNLEAGQALPAKSNESAKSGKNDGDAIEFQFEPAFEFKQEAALGALGIPTIGLRAAAGLSAGVKVNFAGNPSFEIIDALGEIDLSHCGFHADVKFEIFGDDIIEPYRADLGLPRDVPANTCAAGDATCESPQQRCERVFKQFNEAVDRVEKAMRDAAELMRQYRDAVRNGKRLPSDLCRSVVPDAKRPRGFPVGNCPPSGPTETPEQTIQRFADYYRMMVTGFGEKKISEGALSLNDYAQRLIDYLPNPQGEFTLADLAPSPEDQTIIAAQFFIGPIPAFLEVGSTVDYGVLVKARAGLRVGDLVGQLLDFNSVDANSTEVAYAGVSGAPYAGAGLYLFAGVGFGIPGFKVQIGVQGDVQLGTVSLPAYAGAGLWVGSRADKRDAPTSLSSFASGAYLIPRKIYSAQLGYTAGLEARVRDVLSGSIAGKIKLKVLFFSKSWKATILRFEGICSHSDENADGSLPACDFPILSVAGEAVAAEGAFGWGFMKMPTSFPELRLPTRADILAEQAKENGQTQVPQPPPVETLPVQFYSSERVNQTLFDQFCGECLNRDLLPAYPEDDCFSSAECCNQTDVCFKHIQGAKVGRSECRACGAARASNSSSGAGECYLDSHCCANVMPGTGQGYAGICALGTCSTGRCTTCENNADCAPGYGCGVPVSSPAKVCLERAADGSLNQNSCVVIK